MQAGATAIRHDATPGRGLGRAVRPARRAAHDAAGAAVTSHRRLLLAIGSGVLLLHGVALWALHHALSTRPHETVVPVRLLAQLVDPPRPAPVSAPPVLRPTPVPKPAIAKPRPPVAKPEPAPIQKPQAQASDEAPPQADPVLAVPATAVATSTPATGPAAPGTPVERAAAAPGPAPGTTGAAAHASPPAAPAPQPALPALELPSSDAHYLQNPRPAYPPLSLRLREQGTVLVDVLVSDQGIASQVKLKTSSGFFRLDNAALATVSGWRFVPGKRAGVAQSMWYTVPITFTIQ